MSRPIGSRKSPKRCNRRTSRSSWALTSALPARSAYESAKNRHILKSGDEPLYYGYTNNTAVRRVVDHGGASIEFVPAMFVDHLEFQSVFAYYRKVFIHSRSVRRLHAGDVVRPLTNAERLKAFCEMVSTDRYSPLQALFLRVVLAAGMLFWIAGRLLPLPQHSGLPDGRE